MNSFSEWAANEYRAQGVTVISLNMAGSVPDAADLVVTDPVQAGVMAVMAFNQSPLYALPMVFDTVWFEQLAHNERLIGAGVNSNGGFGANITYEQRNFDITNLWVSGS